MNLPLWITQVLLILMSPFCCLHNFPIDPTPDTLSFYATYMSHHIKPSSVSTYLSGIANQLEVYYPEVHQACKSPLVVWTLQGCKCLKGSPTTHKMLSLSLLCLASSLLLIIHKLMMITSFAPWFALVYMASFIWENYLTQTILIFAILKNCLTAPQSPFLLLALMLSCSHAIKLIPSLKGHAFIFAALFTMHPIPSLTLFHTCPHVIICSPSIVNFGYDRMDLTLPDLSSYPRFLLHLVETLPPSVNGLIFRNPCRSWILDAGNVPCTHVADYASELDQSSSVTHIPCHPCVARCDAPARQVVTTVLK